MALIFGIQIACQQTFVALGNATTSLFLAVLRKIILLIPLIYLLPQLFSDQVMAVFLAEPVARRPGGGHDGVDVLCPVPEAAENHAGQRGRQGAAVPPCPRHPSRSSCRPSEEQNN